MATQKLVFDEAALEAIAPPPEGKQLRVFDQECQGLGLWIGASGAKVFFAYRWTKDMPKPQEVKVGPFPDLSVAEARKRARAAIAKMAQEAPPEDPEALVKAGECRQCRNMTMLNARGLCAKCRPLPPCASHPEVTSVARCVGCSQPFCGDCLSARACEACAAKRDKRGRSGGGGVEVTAKRAIASVSKNRKLILAAGAALFVLVEGGLMALNHLENQTPPATAEELYRQRVALAQTSIEAFRAQKGHLPGDAKELAAFIKARGADPLNVVGPGAAKAKDAVIYEPKDETYALTATTAEGERVGADVVKVRLKD